MTSDGQRGVNPFLLKDPVTAKSGVIHIDVLRFSSDKYFNYDINKGMDNQ